MPAPAVLESTTMQSPATTAIGNEDQDLVPKADPKEPAPEDAAEVAASPAPPTQGSAAPPPSSTTPPPPSTTLVTHPSTSADLLAGAIVACRLPGPCMSTNIAVWRLTSEMSTTASEAMLVL